MATKTIHRRESGDSDHEIACGATRHVADDRLQRVRVNNALADHGADKCGRCFTEGRGY